MHDKPVSCVWEITGGCNLRCGHCGSACAGALPGELSTEEDLRLCDMLIDMGLHWVTLSGGEPLTRNDWPLLASRLSQSDDLAVYIVTNGMAIDELMARKLKESSVQQIAISIDGDEATHDSIRGKGCYAQCQRAFSLLKAAGIQSGAVTTVMKNNLPLLPGIRDALKTMGVCDWQLQLGLPMGKLEDKPAWPIEPGEIDRIVDFAHEESRKGEMEIMLADCIGYYSRKEILVRQATTKPSHALPVWDGCNAGKRSFGILHNGDVVGCTSMRKRLYTEGNIKERSLKEIWEDPDAFAWNRQMRPDMLKGYCRECLYVLKCRGGCANMRLCFGGSLRAENKYCLYNVYRTVQIIKAFWRVRSCMALDLEAGRAEQADPTVLLAVRHMQGLYQNRAEPFLLRRRQGGEDVRHSVEFGRDVRVFALERCVIGAFVPCFSDDVRGEAEIDVIAGESRFDAPLDVEDGIHRRRFRGPEGGENDGGLIRSRHFVISTGMHRARARHADNQHAKQQQAFHTASLLFRGAGPCKTALFAVANRAVMPFFWTDPRLIMSPVGKHSRPSVLTPGRNTGKHRHGSAAGLLASGSPRIFRLPVREFRDSGLHGAFENTLPGHSGGSAADLHRLPDYARTAAPAELSDRQCTKNRVRDKTVSEKRRKRPRHSGFHSTSQNG